MCFLVGVGVCAYCVHIVCLRSLVFVLHAEVLWLLSALCLLSVSNVRCMLLCYVCLQMEIVARTMLV